MKTTTNTAPLMTRFRVFDACDRLIGVWYAESDVTAIRMALAEGRDAWSASSASAGGW